MSDIKNALAGKKVRVRKADLKKRVLNHVANGGSVDDLPLDNGYFPDLATIMYWENDDSAYAAEMAIAKQVRSKVLLERFVSGVNKFLTSGTKLEKEQNEMLDKLIQKLQKQEEATEPVVNIEYHQTLPDDFWR